MKARLSTILNDCNHVNSQITLTKETSKMMLIILLACLWCLIGTLTAQSATAEEYVSHNWKFSVTPYMWALSLDGDVTVKGNKSDVDLSFSDIWDHLNFAAMVELEARKNRLGLFVNPLIAQLEDKTHLLDVTINLDIVSFGGYYRLGPWALDAKAGDTGPVLVTDIYAGGRYTYLELKLKGRHELSGLLDAKGDEDWIDPIIGVRTIWSLSPKWTITVMGDIGGFGVGSDFQWMATGLVGYSFHLFGDDNARFFAGYWALGQDYSDGRGSSEFD